MDAPSYAASPSAPAPVYRMTFGQALDRVFRLVKTHLRVFLSIAVIPTAAFAVVFVPILAAFVFTAKPWRRPVPATLPAHLLFLVPAIFLAEIVILVVYALFQAAASYAALQADAGVAVSLKDAYGVAYQKFGRYLWLMILRAIIASAPFFLLAIIVFAGAFSAAARGSSHADPGVAFMLVPLLMLFYAGTGIYIVLVLIWLAFSYPASVEEDLTAAESIARSVRLTRGARGRIFLLGAVIYAITYAATLVMQCVLVVVGGVVFLAGAALHLAMNPWGFIGGGVAVLCLIAVFLLLSACSMSAYATAWAVLYRNQRLFLEGIAPAAPATGSLTP
jgi:hypothetical protein